MSILEVESLNFGYSRNNLILENLNLNVKEGSIYGFLGANGEGKSTTIRTILGLLTPHSGSVSIFGKTLKAQLPSVFRNIGSLIEAPSLYPHLSASDNLNIASAYQGIPKNRILEILDKVDLIKAKDKKISSFSMGMKQRLGLAMALIHNPTLLILDEPTNGLDPNGISEMREIIVQLKKEGKTILLSSHLLSEIEKIATHVGILKNGSMIFEGTLEKLNTLKSSQQFLEIQTSSSEQALLLLSNYTVLSSNEDTIELQLSDRDEIPTIIRLLLSKEIDIYQITTKQSDLEKKFMSITNEDN